MAPIAAPSHAHDPAFTGDEAVAQALSGLRNIVSLRTGAALLPLLLPRLVTTPITERRAAALAAVASVAGPVLHRFFDVLLPGVLAALGGEVFVPPPPEEFSGSAAAAAARAHRQATNAALAGPWLAVFAKVPRR